MAKIPIKHRDDEITPKSLNNPKTFKTTKIPPKPLK